MKVRTLNQLVICFGYDQGPQDESIVSAESLQRVADRLEIKALELQEAS